MSRNAQRWGALIIAGLILSTAGSLLAHLLLGVLLGMPNWSVDLVATVLGAFITWQLLAWNGRQDKLERERSQERS